MVRYLLVGVTPKDPTTIITASAFLVAVTLLAVIAPAWRAMRVDPIVALRNE